MIDSEIANATITSNDLTLRLERFLIALLIIPIACIHLNYVEFGGSQEGK
jgi:hypothetical protein